MSVVNAVPLLLADDGYQISRSVRLRSSASAYFNRTPASAGNRRTWTWSGWVKRGTLGSGTQMLYAVRNAGVTVYGYIGFSSDKLDVVFLAANYRRVTTQVFRDASAWYHIVIAVDTTQATSTDRIKVYVNGSQVTAFDTNSNGSQNADGDFNTAEVHAVGRYGSNNSDYLDGYLTEINFIDGQALTPSSFGESNATTGVWQPKKYTGTYGTNGFYLNFSDNSAATAAAIGKDYSGNGNNWTPNNISVTAGVTYDSMLDVPTQWADGGNGRGNYCVLNPLNGLAGTLSNANLRHTTTVANWQSRTGTLAVSSGKWYWEGTVGSVGANGMTLGGIAASSRFWNGGGNYPGGNVDTYGYYSANGNKQTNGTSVAYGASYTNNDVIGTALDLDAGTLTFYKNGVSQGVAFTGLTGEFVPAMGVYDNTYFADMNFGQRPFAYTPPSGFKALNTLNLPEPTIKKGNQYFDVVLYTGDAVQDRAVTGFGFDLDLAWIKSRNNAGSHVLVNRVVGGDKQLFSNLTNAEQTNADVTNGFTTGGILLGDNVSGTGSTNQNTYTYALWGWKEGATQGFDIVTYTGNGTSQNISHSLGVAPRMMIVKKRSTTGNWPVYHASLGNATSPFLNLTNAANSQPNLWNSTTPTSSVFTVGSDGETNANTATYVAYLFAEVAGFSKFGSYTGNGSSDGPFVFCGFRPRFVMIKGSSFTSNWFIQDGARNGYNVNTGVALRPNLSNAEDGTTFYDMDLLSNGFKLRTSTGDSNSSGATFIFAAFAENPFKNSLAR